MRQVRTFLALVFVLSLGVAVGHAADKMETKEKKATEMGKDVPAMIEKMERQAMEAFKGKDDKTFMSVVDPAGWMIDPSGISPISDAVEMMKQTELESYTIKNYTVHKIGENACLATFVNTYDGTMGGQPYPPGPWYCSTVWTRHGNDWKAVFHQETLGMEEPASPTASD